MSFNDYTFGLCIPPQVCLEAGRTTRLEVEGLWYQTDWNQSDCVVSGCPFSFTGLASCSADLQL